MDYNLFVLIYTLSINKYINEQKLIYIGIIILSSQMDNSKPADKIIYDLRRKSVAAILIRELKLYPTTEKDLLFDMGDDIWKKINLNYMETIMPYEVHISPSSEIECSGQNDYICTDYAKLFSKENESKCIAGTFTGRVYPKRSHLSCTISAFNFTEIPPHSNEDEIKHKSSSTPFSTSQTSNPISSQLKSMHPQAKPTYFTSLITKPSCVTLPPKKPGYSYSYVGRTGSREFCNKQDHTSQEAVPLPLSEDTNNSSKYSSSIPNGPALAKSNTTPDTSASEGKKRKEKIISSSQRRKRILKSLRSLRRK